MDDQYFDIVVESDGAKASLRKVSDNPALNRQRTQHGHVIRHGERRRNGAIFGDWLFHSV